MKSLLLAIIILNFTAFAQTEYDRSFTGETMRVDYFHSGTKGEEKFSLDAVVTDGPWPGSRTNLIDTLALGEFQFRVADLATGRLLFTRGYSTMFNEWQTTDEAAAGVWRTMSESLRFPYPKRPVQVTIARRDRNMVFHELFSCAIDPNDPVQVRKEKRRGYPSYKLLDSGGPARKVDIVVLGDGYAAADMEKYRSDAKHFTDQLFSTEPFKSRMKDFNVHVVEVESGDSGIDIPDKDIWKNNALGTTYNTFGSARYILSLDNKAVMNAAALVPYDFICMLINDTRYGGGGIYNLYATTYTGEQTESQKWQMDYVYVHEFGHSFGGLGDEYYSSSTAYNDFYPKGVEPWEPNVTALAHPGGLKWAELMTAGVQIPTPWEKSTYDSLEALRGKLDRLAPDYYEKREPLYRAAMDLLRNSKSAGKVGAFEGAGYASKGLFRPSVDCRMFSLSLVDFDPVCSAAIQRVIDFYAR
jgi:hypothetical protein